VSDTQRTGRSAIFEKAFVLERRIAELEAELKRLRELARAYWERSTANDNAGTLASLALHDYLKEHP
jgi:hypothetical protein